MNEKNMYLPYQEEETSVTSSLRTNLTEPLSDCVEMLMKHFPLFSKSKRHTQNSGRPTKIIILWDTKKKNNRVSQKM